MVMTEYDICTFIREARDPAERVKICAQMNLCSPEEIRAICMKHGVSISKRVTEGKTGRNYRWTEARVEQLRTQLALGKRQTEIARSFGLTSSAISYAIKVHIKKAPGVKGYTEGNVLKRTAM